MLSLSLLTTLVTIIYCKWENRRRASGKRDHLLVEEDESVLGYRHPSFRYTI